ncbi:MAG: BON domain-containing protein [Gammaproteobacteria bacterium]
MQMQPLLIAFILVLSHEVVLAETTDVPPARSDTKRGLSAPDAENTGINVRDRSDVTVTPEEQGGEAGDREITATIRRAIVKDDSLSLNAHNVKIITRDSVVTLRGPVESTAERTTIGQLAEKTVGVKRVDNQLEINAD